MSTQPTFGASGEADITRIPVTGSSPRENYEVLIGHNLLGTLPEEGARDSSACPAFHG